MPLMLLLLLPQLLLLRVVCCCCCHAASDVDKIITLDRLSIICRISQFSYNMGVHVNITVLVNALFAEWASMVKPTVLVNAFFLNIAGFVQVRPFYWFNHVFHHHHHHHHPQGIDPFFLNLTNLGAKNYQYS